MNIRHVIAVLLSMSLWAGIVHAQQPSTAPPPYPALEGFAFWPSAKVKALVDTLAAANERGVATAVERFGDSGSFKVFVERRAAGDFAPEAQCSSTISSSSRTARRASSMAERSRGDRTGETGEIRGGRIVDGKSQTIAAGDLFFLPAGMPHQIMVAAGKHVYLLAIKATSAKAAAK